MEKYAVLLEENPNGLAVLRDELTGWLSAFDKRVHPHGIRQLGRKLIIPMYDRHGLMWSHQAIFRDGLKRYMLHGRKTANYYPIAAAPVADVLVLAEGFATGATIHECAGYPVAVCFDAQNLTSVSEGAFPTPISLGGRAVGWIEAEVADWLDQQRIQASRSAVSCEEK